MESGSEDLIGAWAAEAVAKLLDECVGTLVMAFAAEVSEVAALPEE
jgi:hypothetical protein